MRCPCRIQGAEFGVEVSGFRLGCNVGGEMRMQALFFLFHGCKRWFFVSTVPFFVSTVPVFVSTGLA